MHKVTPSNCGCVSTHKLFVVSSSLPCRRLATPAECFHVLHTLCDASDGLDRRPDPSWRCRRPSSVVRRLNNRVVVAVLCCVVVRCDVWVVLRVWSTSAPRPHQTATSIFVRIPLGSQFASE